jgi:hypothetical protein
MMVAYSNGAPSGFPTLTKRTVVANDILKAPRIAKKRRRSGIKVHRAEYPRNHRN